MGWKKGRKMSRDECREAGGGGEGRGDEKPETAKCQKAQATKSLMK